VFWKEYLMVLDKFTAADVVG